jgi:glycosyltransferase involved in cell wall biosynthesis
MTTSRDGAAGRPLRVLFLSWRDHGHPEAGGAETFLDHVSRQLVARGHQVTVITASYPGSASEEVLDGRRFLRCGGRFSVYPHALRRLRQLGRDVDVVVDVQNGVPFWSPLVSQAPVVNLVHHVHRQQWPEVFSPLWARFGWWLESRVAPRVYNQSAYVVVSQATRDELVGLGVDQARTTVIYNGHDPVSQPGPSEVSDVPSLVVLGRLVPHKRVELALETVARLRPRHPGLVLQVVGHGYWHDELVATAERLGVSDAVRFHGFVDDDVKDALLASSWVNLLPSLKEGWGLAVIEAGALGVPSIAFREASGTTESVVDGETGFLVDDVDGLVAAADLLLLDPTLRKELGEAAREFAEGFSWEATGAHVEAVLRNLVDGSLPRQGAVATPVAGTVAADRTA